MFIIAYGEECKRFVGGGGKRGDSGEGGDSAGGGRGEQAEVEAKGESGFVFVGGAAGPVGGDGPVVPFVAAIHGQSRD